MVKPGGALLPMGKLIGTYGKAKINLILHRNKGYWVISLFMENKSIS
ncbi:hypothetical protein ES703_70217 [subsurface metagenome]|jgi:hypothetical protein